MWPRKIDKDFNINLFVHNDSGDGNNGDFEALSLLITSIGEQIMATLQEVKDALAAAAVTATEEKQEVLDAVAKLEAEVKDLTEKLAAGGAINAADLDEILASVKSVDAAVEDISVPKVPA